MSVYVDELMVWGLWKYGKSSHLTADSLDELHAFAEGIGLKRRWFQDRKDFPHYDVAARLRGVAVKNGAIEVSARTRIRQMRKEVTND